MVQAVVSTTVTGLQGHPVSATIPATNQALTWTGSTWAGGGPFLALTGGTVVGITAIQGTLRFVDTNTNVAGGGLWRIYAGGAQLNIQMNTAAAGDFSTASTPFQITSSGEYILQGPVIANSAGYAFQAPGGGISCAGQITAGNIVLTTGAVTYNETGAQNHGMGFGWTGNIVAWVDGANVGTLQFATSDASLKQNFTPISVDPLAVLDKIQLQQFDWLPKMVGTEPWQRPHASCGFTAQDVAGLIPEAVSGEPGQLGVDVMSLMGYCIGAIQQLSARVAALDGKTA